MYANIIVDISHEKLDKTFQYLVPADFEQELKAGMCVQVPFGSRTLTGYVIELTDEPEYDIEKIKPIDGILKERVPIESVLIGLAAWIKKSYGGTMNQALKTVLPVKQKKQGKEKKKARLILPKEKAESLLSECERKHHTAQAMLLSLLLECETQPYEFLTKEKQISPSVIRTMQKKGILVIEAEGYYRNPLPEMEKQKHRVSLNEEQQAAVGQIVQDWQQGRSDIYLLHGVTGSGKTEVYMELISDMLGRGKQVIMLIPEIALTFQTVRRFYDRFGSRVSILHSRLSPGERYDQYERAKKGDIDIIIGPRSALFTPFSDLGLIIMDEEHEGSYKSESVPKYHARETAIQRASLCNASIVLGSATPSMESYYHAKKGEYRLLELKQRAKHQPLPVCEVIDMRQELRQGNRSILSLRLQTLIEDRLRKKQQVMLFLNRRGMAGFVSCRSCGTVLRCPHCDVSLSRHGNSRLLCHYCGYEIPMVARCPSCGSKYIGSFKAGTQKIQQLVSQRFPKAAVLRMDYDTTRSKDSYEQILKAFAEGQADILIGTQMIVKGHDFANVTLVGVLAADLSLNVSDYHGAERTFQLITQAAGRAGRGDKEGVVVIQSYQPEHYSIQAAKCQDYKAFYEEELMYRKLLHYSPVWRMLHILAMSDVKEEAERCMDEIAAWIRTELKKAPEDAVWKQLQLIGPTDAAIAKVNDIYRRICYLKHPDVNRLIKIKDFIERKLEQNPDFGKVTVQFDFQP